MQCRSTVQGWCNVAVAAELRCREDQRQPPKLGMKAELRRHLHWALQVACKVPPVLSCLLYLGWKHLLLPSQQWR